MSASKIFAGFFAVFVLIAVAAYVDRSQTLQCRANALASGVGASDIVHLCKK